MIALLLAGLLAVDPPRTEPLLPPQDWSTLPALPLRRANDPTTAVTAFVGQEVAHGRCDAAIRTATGWMLTVDTAVLVTTEGHVRRVVPRAIGCPTVEQYTAGLVWSDARDNVDLVPGDGERWYRRRLTFTWGA